LGNSPEHWLFDPTTIRLQSRKVAMAIHRACAALSRQKLACVRAILFENPYY
jgi:hypothetical protein